MDVQEVAMRNIANVTSSIVKPKITGHFDLKQSMIQLLHANWQFMGLPHEELQQHIPTSWRFFPSGKTVKIRSEIVTFKQKSGESLYSAWERFKGVLRDCPHHNETNEVLAHTFIEELHPETKIMVDDAAGGQVLEKSFDKIYALLNKFSKTNPDWQGEMGRHTVQKSTGVLELDVISVSSMQIDTLANQVNQMTLVINKKQAQPVQHVQIFCEVCRECHTSDLCPANLESVYFMGAQNQYRPQAPQQKYRPPQVEQPTNLMSHIEEMLKTLMADQQAQAAVMINLERQMGQLASFQNTRPVGTLPSDTKVTPKASINVVSSRNRRQLEEVPSKKRKQVTFHEKSATIEVESEKLKESKKPAEEAVSKQPPPLVARPPPLFPQRLQKVKDNSAYKKFLDILKQVQINIPLVYILQKVPKYAKYIKDIEAIRGG
uniref:Retrotransposon gag domain-containing protein n=1 Tax=Nicotiana tabacum TaxID=4097 RepID=A0A1S3ZSK8_TOBAC|nr:PREDICTED: uncharacterized protein LOC107789967 [Nicotiana tabacum]